MENKIQNKNSDQLNHKKKGLAIASLIFAIIGGYISTVSILAVICGHIALNKIKKEPNSYTGKGFAISGLVLGYLGIIIGVALGILKVLTKNKLGL